MMEAPKFEKSFVFGTKDIIALILGALSIWLSYRSNEGSTQAVHEFYWDKQSVVEFRLNQLEGWVNELQEQQIHEKKP